MRAMLCRSSHHFSQNTPPSGPARQAPRRRGAWVTCVLLGAFALLAPAQAAQFTLRWKDNASNETGFRIERATGSSGSFSLIASTGANTTSYVDANLPASTTYRYRIRAYNGSGNSGYSNTATGTTPASSGSNTAPTISAISNRTISEDGSTGAIAFTVGDAQTSAGSLSLSASSSNTSLLPTSGITFGGSGANRTITARPAANASGTATVTVSVSDGSLRASRSFTLTVSSVNDRPTISNISDRTLASGASSGAISFTIGDAETSTSSLRVSASSSNQALLPNSRIALGGSGANRTITVTPASGATGTATVSVSVTDGSLSVSDSFVVTVTSASRNSAPRISAITDRTVATNNSTGAIAFTIGDAETPASNLKLIVNASNKSLVPLSNITLGGSGSNRTVTVRPVGNTTGWSTVWVKVSDGSLTNTASFVVNVSVQSAFTFSDIGSPSLAGSESISGSTISMTAAGADIGGGRTDQFRFGRDYITGDAEITVRVRSLTNTHAWAKAGLMFRASLSADSPYVFVCVTPTSGVSLQYRTSAGAASTTRRTESGAAPEWLKLTRVGNTFYAFHSENGTTWDFIESVSVGLPSQAWGGLALTSHAAARKTTAVFESPTLD